MPRGMFLAEEMLLVMHDEESGAVSAPSDRALRLALAGSVLLDLAHAKRIDQDFGPTGKGDRLFLVDAEPVGHELLDPWLASLAMDDGHRTTGYWLERFCSPEVAYRIRDTALASLERRGVMVRESNGYLRLDDRVRRTRTYRTPDGSTQDDVRLRIMRTLDGETPTPRDVAIVALANASGMFDTLMPDRNAETPKIIDLYSRLELTGRVLCERIRVRGGAGSAGADRPPQHEALHPDCAGQDADGSGRNPGARARTPHAWRRYRLPHTRFPQCRTRLQAQAHESRNGGSDRAGDQFLRSTPGAPGVSRHGALCRPDTCIRIAAQPLQHGRRLPFQVAQALGDVRDSTWCTESGMERVGLNGSLLAARRGRCKTRPGPHLSHLRFEGSP